MEKRLRILFITSEHPDFLNGGLGVFTRDYVQELKKYCDVFCVCFHLDGGIKPLPNNIVDLVIEPKLVLNTFSSDAFFFSFGAFVPYILDSSSLLKYSSLLSCG